MAAALVAAGAQVVWFLDEFAQDAQDREWLPVAGRAPYVVVTKDGHIRRNQLEVDALLATRLKTFVLTATQLHGREQADILVRALPKMRRICHQRGPFIYNITRFGTFNRISARNMVRAARA